mmetsp:Transcript_36020/g.111963  ORF Transcript_36020/g.111963 Transcript_36020/m.111963 type:complete len:251 (+) Transcript_36020:78-830(+)
MNACRRPHLRRAWPRRRSGRKLNACLFVASARGAREIRPAERAGVRVPEPALQTIGVEGMASSCARRARDQPLGAEGVQTYRTGQGVAPWSVVVKELWTVGNPRELVDQVVGGCIAAPWHPDHSVLYEDEQHSNQEGRHDDGDQDERQVVERDHAHRCPQSAAALLRPREHPGAHDRPHESGAEVDPPEDDHPQRLDRPVAEHAVAKEVPNDLSLESVDGNQDVQHTQHECERLVALVVVVQVVHPLGPD